jgi:hypothetical protein
MFYCCTGSDGTIWGCPDQPGRYDEGCLRTGSFEEIWTGGFRRYRGGGWFVRMRGVWFAIRRVNVVGDAR